MLNYYRLWCRYPRPIQRLLCIFISSFIIGLIWSILTTLFYNRNDNDVRVEQPPQIFCFALTANDRHLTSSRAIIYSWGKRCDRFYFVTRLQNSSVELMTLQKFENDADITPTTITQTTLDVLLHLRGDQLAAAYHWFLRASDDSYVIMPNLRQLVARLDRREAHRPFVYVGDVEQMYEKYQFSITGSVMLFNRKALERLTTAESDNDENDENNFDTKEQRCLTEMIYDHQFVKCIKQLGIHINPVNDNLILSQNLSTYRMDRRLKVKIEIGELIF